MFRIPIGLFASYASSHRRSSCPRLGTVKSVWTMEATMEMLMCISPACSWAPSLVELTSVVDVHGPTVASLH